MLQKVLHLNTFFSIGQIVFPSESSLENFAIHSYDKWSLFEWIRSNSSSMETISFSSFLPIYMIYQRVHFAVLSLQRHFKKRKYTKYDAYDMDLNLIEDKTDKRIISIVEDKTIYWFKDRDLYRIFYNALTYGYYLFPSAQYPKNPWTNKPFSKHNIYNILFFLKRRCKTCQLMQSFLECNLDLNLFSCRNFSLIQEKLIYQRVKSMNLPDILESFLEMFVRHIHDYEIQYSKFTSEFILEHSSPIRYIVRLYYHFLYTSVDSPMYEYHNRTLLTKTYLFVLKHSDKFYKRGSISSANTLPRVDIQYESEEL